MLIDWFTVVAQILNFVILVWLMKRFLFKPILRVIHDREQHIEEQLTDASAKQAEALRERDDFRHKNEALEQQRAALLNLAREEADAERRRLLAEAQQAAEAASAKRKAAVEKEAKDLSRALRLRTEEEVFAVSRMALRDLAETGLEERLGEVFARRLRQTSGPAREQLRMALAKASEQAVIRSAFDLPAHQREAIQAALDETFAARVPTRFETAPELIAGIELTAGNQRLSWNIADYLKSLERELAMLLQEPKPEVGLRANNAESAQASKPSTAPG